MDFLLYLILNLILFGIIFYIPLIFFFFKECKVIVKFISFFFCDFGKKKSCEISIFELFLLLSFISYFFLKVY